MQRSYSLNDGQHINLPIDISEENDIIKIIGIIKLQFGIDLNVLKEIIDKHNSTKENEILLKSYKDYYNDLVNWGKQDIENEFKRLTNLYQDKFGYSDKEMKKMSKEYSSKKLRLFRKVSGILFITSLTLFVIALICLLFIPNSALENI